MAEQELDIASLSARVEHLEAEANLRKKNISWLKNYLDALKQEFNNRPEVGQWESLQEMIAQLTEQVESLQQRVFPLDEMKTGETLATDEIAVTESVNAVTEGSDQQQEIDLPTQQTRLRGFSDEEFKAERIMLLVDRIYALEEERHKQPISTEEFLRRYHARERDFTEINLAGLNLSKQSLGNLNLNKANFRGANLFAANMHNVNLSNANLSDANLTEVDLSNKVNLSYANLSGANLSNANLKTVNLIGAKLKNANLSKANLFEADLQEAILQGANLQHGIYNSATMFPRGFDPTEMGAYLIAPGTSLQQANLSRANLQSVDLSVATLDEVDLRGANLQDAKLRGANLNSADLRTANLNSTDLSGADLTNAKLGGANLIGARLTGAIMPDSTTHE